MVYLPLLIAVGQKGSYSSTMTYGTPFDTKEKYGFYIKHSPFLIRPKAKNIITQSWLDQEGDDVYLPSYVTHEAYDLELEFVYYRQDNFANENARLFVKEIEGKWLKMYETYTKQGRQGVYLISADEDPVFKRRGLHDTLIFKMKFRVNDPDTNITL